MRCDQFRGLHPIATEYLSMHEVPAKFCDCCKRDFPRQREVIGYYHGMFDSEYPLHLYQLVDGRLAVEFLQAAPWSSGPVFFLGLCTSDGLEFLWEEEEIDKA